MKLIDGRIPAFTECPYTDKCNGDICHHTGTKHEVPFSCAFARAFELLAIALKTGRCRRHEK